MSAAKILGNPKDAIEATEVPVAALNPDRRKERRECRIMDGVRSRMAGTVV
jgi:hypothetical protein